MFACRQVDSRYRAGLTLIELLIVIAIIGVLASLMIGAVFTLRESQVKSFTETTIRKLTSSVDQQWKAVIDQVREENVPGWAMALANNDQRRGRVIYLKARLKQEFPVTFDQAINPSGVSKVTGIAAGSLPSKPSYKSVPASASPEWQSSHLLYLILSQGRRGMSATSNPEDAFDSTMIQDREIGGVKYKVFVDAWGTPLRFYAFPSANTELNAKPYVPTTSNASVAGGNSIDIQDPEGTLQSGSWPQTLQAQFSSLMGFAPNPARHLIPVIASAGRDGQWGIDPVTMATTDGEQAADNIYSYRLRRAGARGD